MAINKIGNIGIRSVVNTIGETQRVNNFRFVSAVLPEGVALNITEAALPSFSVDVLEVHHGNAVSKQAGSKINFEAGSFTFRDSITQNVQAALYDLFKDVYNIDTEEGGYKFVAPEGKRPYAADWFAFLSDPSGNVAERRVWRFANGWFSELSFGTVSVEGVDILTITATFQYDWAVLESGGSISESV